MFKGERHKFLNSEVILKMTYCTFIVAIILVWKLKKMLILNKFLET